MHNPFFGWARVLLVISAPLLSLATFASAQTTYFISARLGCEIHHPVYGLDLAALCIPGESG